MQDLADFQPYIFQILAQMLSYRRDTVPELYLSILPGLMSPTLWERHGNIPSLVPLLQTMLRVGGPQVIASKEQLRPLLGVFQRLLASKLNDHYGFYLLNSIVEFLPLQTFAPYLRELFTLVFQRLQVAKTDKCVRGFLVFLSLLIGKHGAGVAIDTMDAIQPGCALQPCMGIGWAPRTDAHGAATVSSAWS